MTMNKQPQIRRAKSTVGENFVGNFRGNVEAINSPHKLRGNERKITSNKVNFNLIEQYHSYHYK